MSVLKISFFVLSAVVATAWCYAGGAPEAACVDMVPQHAVDPQKTPFPYTVTADKAKISVADKVKISIAGKKPFKGFLLQVRDGKEAVGTFNIPADDKVARTSDCFSKKQNAATHKNSLEKSKVTVEWVPPRDGKGTYTVHATVAENGGVFWVNQPTAKITVA